jgi:small subunit ribosomal protein S21
MQYKNKYGLGEGTIVHVFDNNIEVAMKQLKSKLKKEDTMIELKQRRYYEKPSSISHRKKVSVKRRNIREKKRSNKREL